MIDIAQYLSKGGLSLDRLGTLCRFVDAGGLSAAAEHDHARISLYSRQIKELEGFFGVSLTRREGRASVPTDDAVRLSTLVRDHFAALNEFAEAARRAPARLVIASSHSVLEWWVMPRLPAITKAMPDGARIVLLDLRTRDIATALENRQADIGLLRSDAVPLGMKRTTLTSFGYELFVNAALVRGRSARDLLHELPLAVSMGGQFREQFEAAAKNAGVHLNIALECSSFTLAAASVAKGYGAVLPAVASAAFSKQRVANIQLPFKPDPVRNLVAAWPENMPGSWLSQVKNALK